MTFRLRDPDGFRLGVALSAQPIRLDLQALALLFERSEAILRAQIFIEQSLAPRWPEVNMVDLQEAWADVFKRAKLTAHHMISREELSVREHMTGILRRLQSAKFVEFSDLFDPARGVPVLVVNFIALLELAKETLIEITQAEAFAPIYVRLAYAPV